MSFLGKLSLKSESPISWFLLVLVVAVTTYLLTLNRLPPGILNDEADIGYEAYSIAQTGKDQWGNVLPLQYFSGFGGTRLPLLVYWTVPFVKTMGLTAESIRLAGVVAGLFTVFGFFLLLKKLYRPPFAGVVSLLLVINPWFWGLTRTTNEAVLALALTLWATWLLFESKEREIFLPLSAVFFGLSAYAYYSSQIFVPIFLAFLILVLPWLRATTPRLKVLSLAILILLISPLLAKTIMGGGSATRLNQTGLTSNVSLVGELNYKRGACEQQAPAIWCRLVYNKPSMWASEVSANYLNHFSLTFLFSDNWFVGILPPGRLFYFSLLPGLIFGVFTLTKEKFDRKWLWLGWLLIAPVADSLTSNGHAMRAFLMVPPLVVISAFGWLKMKKAWLIVGLIVLIFEVSRFTTDYWWYFPKKNSVYTHYQYQPLFARLFALEKNYPNIYISNSFSSIKQYVFYVFYSQYDPKKFQSGFGVEWERETDGWIWVKRIGKWHFVKILPKPNEVPAGSLFAADPKEFQETPGLLKELEILEEVKYLSGDAAFDISVVQKLPK